MGLSPRVRGNRSASAIRGSHSRSIPACAGEPMSSRPMMSPTGVYPRVCGGTLPSGQPCAWPWGLSPRVRGNHFPQEPPPPQYRSIPACAGEPSQPSDSARAITVYPRVCGGTWEWKSTPITATGLSPRVRGNRPGRSEGVVGFRSIPACAGEPRRCWAGCWPDMVYPRVCGGTYPPPTDLWTAPGLSPRVRGNLRRGGGGWRAVGSIPACAGEPALLTTSASGIPVYPRVCGGT